VTLWCAWLPQATPASKVASGEAQFCVVPSESVISAHTWGAAPKAQDKPKIKAVATLLQARAARGTNRQGRASARACLSAARPERSCHRRSCGEALPPRPPATQASTSAVVTLKSSGISRPAELDGKKYASYAARYGGLSPGAPCELGGWLAFETHGSCFARTLHARTTQS
jgi:hypothetical protein